MQIVNFTGTIMVTAAYVLVYYLIQSYSLHLKIRLAREYKARGERFDRYFGQDREMLAADRYQLNMLEHMPPFMVLLWLHAAVVGDATATVAGSIYVATRIAYPFVVGRRLGGGIKSRVFYVTFFGYGVILYLLGSTLRQIL